MSRCHRIKNIFQIQFSLFIKIRIYIYYIFVYNFLTEIGFIGATNIKLFPLFFIGYSLFHWMQTQL